MNIISVLTFGWTIFLLANLVTAQQLSCEKIYIPSCLDIGYNYTHFPNGFNHVTQSQAAEAINEFNLLFSTGCSPYIKRLVCSVYLPFCSGSETGSARVCREVCDRARMGCEPIINVFGLEWPDEYSCDKFPTTECITDPRLTTRAPPIRK